VTDDMPIHTSHHPIPGHPCRGAKRPRGGRRPGAGAPRGNLNALKHGRRSRQFAEIGAIIAADPGASATLLALAGRRQAKHRRAEEVAATLVAGLYAHARDIAQGKPSPGPFAGIPRLKDQAKASNAALSDEGREMLAGLLAEMDEEIKTPVPTINRSPNNQIPNTKTPLIERQNPLIVCPERNRGCPKPYQCPSVSFCGPALTPPPSPPPGPAPGSSSPGAGRSRPRSSRRSPGPRPAPSRTPAAARPATTAGTRPAPRST